MIFAFDNHDNCTVRSVATPWEVMRNELQHYPRMQDNYISHIIESLSIGLISVDQKGTIVAFNSAAEKFIGKKRADVLGQDFDGAFGCDFFQNKEIQFRLLNKIVTRTEITTRIQRFDKRFVDVRLSMAPVFSKTGKKIGTALMLLDSIQQSRKLDDQASRTGRLAAMGEMAAQIAHEIRNPLGSIELFAGVLERDLEGFEELKAIAGHISSGVNSINTIISNLLSFIQPNQKAEMQALDVHEPLKDSLFFADHIFEANDAITVSTDFGPTPMVINGDSELLKQIALNLILNAIQAMPDGGVLTISTRKIEDKGTELAEIRFADTGCGISETDQAKIFDPFFSTKTRGTGLGLTIVQNITKIHGGDLHIRSTEAVGTECIITLPLAIRDNPYEAK